MSSGWENIESAPLDGTPVLLFSPYLDGPVKFAVGIFGDWWFGKGWVETVNEEYEIKTPTHWKRLDPPPA